MSEAAFSESEARDLDGLVDLASERLGGRVVEANDEFFAPKENLVRSAEPVFDAARYTDHGKWMDGWETRRRRSPGHDWCVLRLAAPGRIRRLVVDTTHFRGNHPEACRLEGSTEADGDRWTEILPRASLAGDSRNPFAIEAPGIFERLRLSIFPDGGVARLRVLGVPAPDWVSIVASGERVDLASALRGGAPLACSDRFFSDPRNLLVPGPSTHMGDGWETRRRRGPGHDWVVIRLGHRGLIEEIEVDTTHFKGNYPAACSLEGLAVGEADPGEPGSAIEWDARPWKELLPRSELGPDAVHRLAPLPSGAPVTHVRFSIHPDGGVARLRLHGRPVP